MNFYRDCFILSLFQLDLQIRQYFYNLTCSQRSLSSRSIFDRLHRVIVPSRVSFLLRMTLDLIQNPNYFLFRNPSKTLRNLLALAASLLIRNPSKTLLRNASTVVGSMMFSGSSSF
jgi:hypothetical protein